MAENGKVEFNVGSLVVFNPDQPTENSKRFIERLRQEYSHDYPLQVYEISLETGRILSLKGKSRRTVYSSSPNTTHTTFDQRWLKLWVREEAKPSKNWWQKLWDAVWKAFSASY